MPNVGKSTLFNALTGNSVLAANYPFATIEPNTGMVPVPDERLAKLAELYHTYKIIPATVTFVDIAGLVAGASEGEGLGNQFLGHIRACNAIVHVVRAFDDTDVQHVSVEHRPKPDIDVINTELILADLQTVGRRKPKLDKEARANPKLKPMADKLQKIHDVLNGGRTVNSALSAAELEDLEDLQLLTMKPVIYVFNVNDNGLTDTEKVADLMSLVSPSPSIFVSAKLEEELRSLDEAEAEELLQSYGFTELGLEQLIREAYSVLGLQSFLTAGEKEVRAWTIPKGATAPQAAGVIHGDFERGFIAADIVSYADLIKAGSLAAARSAGLVRTEGKNYIMQPDDVVEFKFNV